MIAFHLPYFYSNFQAIIIIAKLSFWINKPFFPSVIEALDQYKQKGYVQKLKIDITADFMHSGHNDYVTLLYKKVTEIDGKYLFKPCSAHEQFVTEWNMQYGIQVIYWLDSFALRLYLLIVHRWLLICIPLVAHTSVSNFLSNADVYT